VLGPHPDYRGPFATQGAGHFNDDGETAADTGLLTGTTGEVGFTGPPMGFGFSGLGLTGPPREVCFAGAARGVCFLIPPIELWAEAGRRRSPPIAAATMMMAIILFFMGPIS
jgi:hypothetical protein